MVEWTYPLSCGLIPRWGAGEKEWGEERMEGEPGPEKESGLAL